MNRNLFFALLLATSSQLAAQADLAVGSGSGAPGVVVSISVSITPTQASTAFQLDIGFDTASVSAGSPVVGSATSDHVVESNLVSPGVFRILVRSPTNALLLPGEVVEIPFTVAQSASGGATALTATAGIVADPAADAVLPLVATGGTITIGSVVTDLEVGKTVDKPEVKSSDSVTYTVTVDNLGPDDAVGATVTDLVPGELTLVQWSCTADPGSTCTASGGGDIVDTVDVLAGEGVTYTVDGVVNATPSTFVNTADASVAAGSSDSDLSNNTAAVSLEVFSCLEELPLSSGQWQQISLACDPGAASTVADVLGDDLDGAYDSDWVVFERDAAAQSYLKKALTDPLTMGTGYWIRTNLASQVVRSSGADNVATSVPLVADTTDGAGCGSSAGRCNMVGTPHAFEVCWADVEFLDGANTLDLAGADPGGACQGPNAFGNGCVASRIAHKWTGSSYAPFDGVTPGLEGTLAPFDGFWVSAVKSGVQIRVPALPGNCGAPAGSLVPASPSGSRPLERRQEWFVRLIAESGRLKDSANVLGLLRRSRRGFDSHDLPELAPFGNEYLTIVFPKPEWGDRAGDYSSDFRSLRGRRSVEHWRFEVRSSDPAALVTLRWEGPPEQISKTRLADLETGEVIEPQPGGFYTFTMTGSTRSFVWRVRSR